eukprot:CAMPEP_0170404840 /NCGR_PEP_ID=MMETSP0117_2-20130122/26853_1 /TAXON_ID=400756 /ORGANISM="Durinskia baltica, Strain CSIRO CS-38" /LENGTH=140 /DNA_ID=CAMNT_0010661897 /DNA_START=304 /DNA_END=726 /DNA_ORIENTATION=+
MAPLAPEDPGMSVAEGTVASPCQATSLPRYREECTEWACKAPGPWPAYTSRKVGSFACKVLHDGNSHLNLQFGLGQMSGSQSQAHSGSAHVLRQTRPCPQSSLQLGWPQTVLHSGHWSASAHLSEGHTTAHFGSSQMCLH